jgi:hypothetical protein
MMGEHDWQRALDDRARMEARARAILGVKAGVSRQALKRAFRRAARKHHPDRNPGDAGAADRFRDAVAAHELLAKGKPDRRLLAQSVLPVRPICGGYYLDNSWGYFLWWRDNFFSARGPGM